MPKNTDYQSSEQITEAKAAFLHHLGVALNQRGVMVGDVFLADDVDTINFRLTGDFPVSLNIYEEHQWSARSNLETAQTLAGHTATSVAAWVSILEVACNNLANYPAFQDFCILTATASPPFVSVNLVKKLGYEVEQYVRFEGLDWPIRGRRSFFRGCEIINLPPMTPFRKLPTNAQISSMGNGVAEIAKMSEAWRIIKNAYAVKLRYLMHTASEGT